MAGGGGGSSSVLAKLAAVVGEARHGRLPGGIVIPLDNKLVVIAGAVGVAVVAAAALRIACAPADGLAYENDHQKAFDAPFSLSVAPGTAVGVRKVTAKDIDGAADTLAAGNRNDPMLVACAAEAMDEAERAGALKWLYRVVLRSLVPSSYGAVPLATAGNQAVALWYPGGYELKSSSLLFHGALGFVYRFSGWDRRGRFLNYSSLIRKVKARIMAGHEGAFFYLLTYATAPGLSATDRRHQLHAVLLPVLQRADRLGQPAYVEVTNAADVPEFEALGFKRVEEGRTFELNKVQVECMRREASTTGVVAIAPALAAAGGGGGGAAGAAAAAATKA